VQGGIGQKAHDECVGGVLRILVEGPGKTGQGWLTGRSEGNIIVEFEGDAALAGQFAEIRITKAANWALFGQIWPSPQAGHKNRIE